MRESLRKVHEMAMPNTNPATSASYLNSQQQQQNQAASVSFNNSNVLDDKNFFLNLENSKWLEHVRFVLNGSLKIVRYLLNFVYFY